MPQTQTVTTKMIAQQMIKQAYIALSLQKPITRITADLVDFIALKTGIDGGLVEEVLEKQYPTGSVSSFMTKYFEMAFKGREEAVEFEKATAELFQNVFGFEARHVGSIGLTPDVLLTSDYGGYQAIIDNKAYNRYTISNDHYNRMVHNYIENLGHYSHSEKDLVFFSYIAGGFGNSIDKQIQNIYEATGVKGSAINVSNIIRMVERHQEKEYSHEKIRKIFSLNKRLSIKDVI